MAERIMTLPMPQNIAPINIQENVKNYEKETAALRSWLRSRTLLGQVLRVLVGRLKYPERPYSSLDLQVLLLLSLAEIEPPPGSLADNASNAAMQAGRL